MKKLGLPGALLAGAVLLLPGPALADVKAGVDAWSRGDFAAAVREWQVPAERGDADAQFNLGQAYKLGRGVKQDLAKAEGLFGKAAAQGHLQASDNYGLLLFQRGQRAQALPYIRAAADRGDPRAQYLLGVSHFNGDNVPKDWVRAYALVSLAQQAGLEQAKPALAQMDQYIPIEQRQQAVALSAELAQEAEATRARQLAAVDLGATVPASSAPPTHAIRPATRPPVSAAPAMPTVASAEAAVAEAQRVVGSDTPRTAGADYARPQVAAALPAPPRPVAAPAPAPTPVRASPPPAAEPPRATGNWRVQLGAFGVPANADAQWNRVKARPELAGHPRLNVRAGVVIKLQAGGFPNQQAAQAACTRLSAAGFGCLAVSN